MAGVVAVIVIGADRVVARIASRRVASLIGTSWPTASASASASVSAPRPEVRISGPFLPQLIVGRFRQVRIRVPAFTVSGIEFGGLDATLTDVRAPARTLSEERGSWRRPRRGVVAGELTATANIPFAALADRLPPGFTLRRHGRERRGHELRIHGWVLAVPVTGTVEVSADLRSIAVNPRVAGIPSLVGFRLELPALPPGVVITSISLADTALTVRLAGGDVQFAPAGTVDRGAVDQVRRTRAG